ncbi:MAG: cysteine--tRNA ligase [Desulfobacterales bacterium]|nr:cysteine--tRNA ligase [Desulfobacterales bacterium]
MSYSILDAIGNTPLIQIQKLNPNPRVTIYAKIEYMNPGGSIKDRAALYMIEAGEKSKELTRDKIVIEATSGNTGIGLALICSIKGYPLKLAMSEAASQERQKILRARGAEIVLTPAHLGTDGAIEEVYRLARENPKRYFVADQFNNPANWQAHYYGTAQEIFDQTQGRITACVAAMGTTGTLMGVSRKLKEYNPNIRIIGVEPYLGHKIQGLKNMKESYQPGIYEKERLDLKVNIEDEEAFEMTRRLAREEALFVGMSSGAAMAAAIREAAQMESGTIVVIFPDSGERYLSTSLFTVHNTTVTVKLYNHLTGKKEPLIPISAGKVSMYTCGPTPNTTLSLGECRRFVVADMISRYLSYRHYDVKHLINITDMDDKTIQESESQHIELGSLTEKYFGTLKQNLAFLNIQSPDFYPKVTEHLNDIISVAKQLEEKGYAYEKLRSLYFNISRFPEYGKLSGTDINTIKLGATVNLDEYEKNNPRDFTIMKRARLSELKRGIYVKTDWGNVRPSWHIQGVTMAMKYLGQCIDIHMNSHELEFPHHENEMAIAKALTGKPLANYWLNCEPVMMDSKGHSDVMDDKPCALDYLQQRHYTGREIRFWLLSTHYRKPIIFSVDRLEDAIRTIRKMDICIHSLCNITEGKPFPELDQLLYNIKYDFVSAMDDDFNIAQAIASIFKQIKQINILLSNQQLNQEGATKIISAFQDINSVLQIFHFDTTLDDPEIQRLIQERQTARAQKNFALADQLRMELVQRGIHIQDQKIKN